MLSVFAISIGSLDSAQLTEPVILKLIVFYEFVFTGGVIFPELFIFHILMMFHIRVSTLCGDQLTVQPGDHFFACGSN